jgi:HAD superfamily hydrolase (TIGR01549 family)
MLQAICFDVDGTLYLQRQLRLMMLWRLLSRNISNPRQAFETFRIIAVFREAQETLRTAAMPCDVAAAQLDLTCRLTGITREKVASCTATWFDQEPLPLLRRCMRPGLKEFLETAKVRGIKLAVLSDYPAEPKLRALEIRQFFDVVVSAQDTGIGYFKPNPAGLNLVTRELKVEKSDMLYVGDREEVDAEVADRAGVPAAIIGQSHSVTNRSCVRVRTFRELQAALGL